MGGQRLRAHLAGFLLLGGRAADLLGGRPVFIGAMATFSVASLGSGLATAEGVLIGSRVVQGVSAGVLAPATLSILTANYREPEIRARALAIWTAVAVGGGAAGGTLGGALTAGVSWRWIFFVNVPLGAALVALAWSRLPRDKASLPDRGLDLAGAVTVTGGLTALVWALIRSNEAGWGAGEVVGGFALAAALLTVFVLIETRVARAPLLPFSVFRSRPLTAGNVLSFLSFVPVPATWYFLTLYLQGVRGYTPMEAGVLFLPMSLAVVGGSQVSFRLISRVDARALFAAGGMVAAAGLAWLAQFSADTDPLWVIVPASIAMVGGGLMVAPITIAATSATPEDGGLASGLLNTTRQIGGALGLVILGAIAASHTTATALRVGAAIFVATAIAGTIALPGRLGPATAGSEPAGIPARGNESMDARVGDAGARGRHPTPVPTDGAER